MMQLSALITKNSFTNVEKLLELRSIADASCYASFGTHCVQPFTRLLL
jgi:hypothetical protein